MKKLMLGILFVSLSGFGEETPDVTTTQDGDVYNFYFQKGDDSESEEEEYEESEEAPVIKRRKRRYPPEPFTRADCIDVYEDSHREKYRKSLRRQSGFVMRLGADFRKVVGSGSMQFKPLSRASKGEIPENVGKIRSVDNSEPCPGLVWFLKNASQYRLINRGDMSNN